MACPHDFFDLEGDFVFQSEETLDQGAYRRLAVRYPLFHYSAMYWARHFSSCDAIAPDALREAVMRLTERNSPRLKNWLRYSWHENSMNIPYPQGFSPLTTACFFNHPVLLRSLLENCRPQYEKDIEAGLSWAARICNNEVIEVLLRTELKPNLIAGMTPRGITAQLGHADVVRLLIADERVNVGLGGWGGRSPLSLAASTGSLDVVNLLLRHGKIEPDSQDVNHWTPLFWAVGGNHPDVVRMLS